MIDWLKKVHLDFSDAARDSAADIDPTIKQRMDTIRGAGKYSVISCSMDMMEDKTVRSVLVYYTPESDQYDTFAIIPQEVKE